MSYHRLKMDEVNKIIAELWNETYDGGGATALSVCALSKGCRTNTRGRFILLAVFVLCAPQTLTTSS